MRCRKAKTSFGTSLAGDSKSRQRFLLSWVALPLEAVAMGISLKTAFLSSKKVFFWCLSGSEKYIRADFLSCCARAARNVLFIRLLLTLKTETQIIENRSKIALFFCFIYFRLTEGRIGFLLESRINKVRTDKVSTRTTVRLLRANYHN